MLANYYQDPLPYGRIRNPLLLVSTPQHGACYIRSSRLRTRKFADVMMCVAPGERKVEEGIVFVWGGQRGWQHSLSCCHAWFSFGTCESPFHVCCHSRGHFHLKGAAHLILFASPMLLIDHNQPAAASQHPSLGSPSASWDWTRWV